jgi:Zn-dependent metalloprotease
MTKKLLRATSSFHVACKFFIIAGFSVLLTLNIAVAQKPRVQPKEHSGDAASAIIQNATYIQERPNSPFPASVRMQPLSNITFQAFLPWLMKQVQADPLIEFKLVSQEIDEIGFQHFRYVETYMGIPIDKSWYIVHVKNNMVVSFNGLALNITQKLSPKAALTEPDGLIAAKRFVNAARYKWEDAAITADLRKRTHNPNATYLPHGELTWFVSNDNTNFRLSYKFDINSASPDKAQRVYVDASGGAVVFTVPLESNCDGTSVNTIFNGSQSISTDKYQTSPDKWRLRDDCDAATIRIRDWNSSTCSPSAVEIDNTANTWTTMNQRFGGTVLWSTKQAYYYWLNVRGRNSYDNSNGGVEGYINAVFSSTSSPPCTPYTDNASMSFSGGTLKVGLGSSGTLSNSWSALDILAHEFTHAVTGSTAALTYSNESGALNESFSDIFGEATENYITGSNDWLMGAQRTSGAIRSMASPKIYSNPDTYLGTYWYTGTGDNGGVHTNSGVQNHWFYLLAAGGSGTNDNSDAFTVSGIGLADASAIAARNLTHYLGSSSNYSDARTNSIQAAIDLFGACSNQVKQTTNAWYAVGVGDQYFDANTAVTSNYNGRDVSCFNACDGKATVNVVSGSSPTFSWSTGATTQSVTGLCPGTYSVTVTNDGGSGCTVTKNVTINNAPLLTASPAATSNYHGYGVSCAGSSDGTAAANPAGGTPPYFYSWSNGQTTAVATGLSATTYSVTVTDANGCTSSGNVTLTQPPPLTIDAGPNKLVYYGYPDSACTDMTATGAGGGVPPYTLTWSTGSHSGTEHVCPTSTTVYTITIQDQNGCTKSDDVTVCVIDVRCGNNLDKVTICHKTGSKNNPSNTLCVALPAAIDHIKNHPGDELAACGTVKTCSDAPVTRSGGPGRELMTEGVIRPGLYMQAIPNPFSGTTTINYMIEQDDVANLALFDMSGKRLMILYNGKIEANRLYQSSVSASTLSSGMYILKLTTRNGNNYVGKLIVAK